jgi:LPXTG-motif cell wall-anchored protein
LEVEVKTMKTRQLSSLTSAGLLCASAFLVPQAKASDWDMMKKVTINHPFEIPGRVLPAGTYTFKRLEPRETTPDVVVFSDAADRHVYEMVLALPVYRDEPSDHTVVTFEERAANAPQAIKDWWYPGRLVGEEFLYPKAEVLTSAAVPLPALAPAPAPPAPAQAQAAPIPQPQAAPQEPVETAQAQPAPAPAAPEPPAAQPANTQPPQQLPKTGSDLPLAGLLGMSSAGAGFLLRRKSAPAADLESR